MWLILIVMIAIATVMYLIVVGGNMNKSEYERAMETEEEMEYLKQKNINKSKT
ncbi:MAG: hypothetical protein IJH12_10565 [Clostridia bacterium]|nr:hypothetical protein [Clostridia bacterium]